MTPPSKLETRLGHAVLGLLGLTAGSLVASTYGLFNDMNEFTGYAAAVTAAAGLATASTGFAFDYVNEKRLFNDFYNAGLNVLSALEKRINRP